MYDYRSFYEFLHYLSDLDRHVQKNSINRRLLKNQSYFDLRLYEWNEIIFFIFIL
jgi:hypothetical protein